MYTNQLLAGAGRAEIRFPQELFPIEGFRGVHDDPAARVLLLSCGEQIAIVCLELVMLSPDGIDDVKKVVAKITNTKCENIWVHTTHVITTPHAPHAPVGMGGVPLEIEEKEKRTLERKIALFSSAVINAVEQAAEEAVQTLQIAKMGVGTGTCSVNVNRDVKTPFGWWINFNPDGFSNHTATILRFDDEDGKPVAVLISCGLKPCAIDNSEMDKNNRLVSSDVPGLACKLLEEMFGVPCLFAMGAAGDQVPLEQAWYDVVKEDGTVCKVDLGVPAGLEIVDRLGKKMMQEIAPIIEATVCDQKAPVIQLAEGGISWAGKERGKMVPTAEPQYIEKGIERVAAVAIAIGEVALVGLKPEINAVTEAQLQKVSPFEHTLIVTMVDGGQKYMPDLTSYENVTWEAQSAPLMPGAAEAWVGEAADILNRMYRDAAAI